jgi:hypothetical protein
VLALVVGEEDRPMQQVLAAMGASPVAAVVAAADQSPQAQQHRAAQARTVL